MTKRCGGCKANKLLSEFARNVCRRDALQSVCKFCQKERDKLYYRRTKTQHDAGNRRLRLRNQLAVSEYLKTHPCVDCSISNPVILTFDHVRGEKRGNVSDMVKRPCGLAAIFQEIAKCEVRCFNCHMIRPLAKVILTECKRQ